MVLFYTNFVPPADSGGRGRIIMMFLYLLPGPNSRFKRIKMFQETNKLTAPPEAVNLFGHKPGSRLFYVEEIPLPAEEQPVEKEGRFVRPPAPPPSDREIISGVVQTLSMMDSM